MHGMIPPERMPEDGLAPVANATAASPDIWPAVGSTAGWAEGYAEGGGGSAGATAAAAAAATTLGGRGAPAQAAASRATAVPAPLPPLLLGMLVAVLDLIALGGAGLLAQALTSEGGIAVADARGGAVALVAVLTVAFCVARGAYDHPVIFSARPQIRLAVGSAAAAMATVLAASLAFGVHGQFEPAWVAAALPLGAASLVAGRAAAAALLRGEGRSRTARRTVLVGSGPLATRLLNALEEADDRSLTLLGVVDDYPTRRMASAAARGRRPALPHLGTVDSPIGMIRRGEVDEVVIALPASAEERIAALVERIGECAIDIRLAPDLVAHDLRTPADRRRVTPGWPVAAMPLVRRKPICGWGAVVKTVEDYVFAVAALAVAAVPMALIALAVRLESPGPVLFRQRRTGFNGRDFYVLKFRTMYADATDHEVLRQVREGDPRVTPVGAILRKTSLDELPQIFNVLRGEMSFVGPRPHAPGTRAGNRRFEEVVDNYASRHRVKPGLTGLAQVRGWRGATETEEKLIRRVESDLEYIDNWSVWLDIVIIFRTLVAVARMRNAH